MKYNLKEDAIELSSQELVYYARKRFALTYSPNDEEHTGKASNDFDRLQFLGHKETQKLYWDGNGKKYHFQITCDVDDIQDNQLTFIFHTTSDPNHPSEEEVKQARGEAFVATYILKETCGGTYRIRILYVGEQNPVPHIVEEEPKEEDLNDFFDKLLKVAELHAEPEIDRVKNRLPTLLKAKFPYKGIRDSQREMMEMVYHTIKQKKSLYMSAPTGTGKTIGVLYPAIRALGEGEIDKVFYFTQKNTNKEVVQKTILDLVKLGCSIRAILLNAKEQLCPEHLLCRKMEKCKYSPMAKIKEDRAARELLSRNLPVVGEQEFLEMAVKYEICPSELALRYAQYADLVIGDCNYLFHPDSFIRRFFTNNGPYLFLIDEAHNLVERIRSTYKVELSLTTLNQMREELSTSTQLLSAINSLISCFNRSCFKELQSEITTDKEGKRIAFASSHELPQDVVRELYLLKYLLFDQMNQEQIKAIKVIYKKHYYALQSIINKIECFDEHFILFYRLQGEMVSMEMICLDPSAIVKKCLEKGHASVLFSATLSPLEYYRDLLGGTKTSKMLELPSPYEEEHLCIAIMDKISTRYLEREDTIKAIAKAVIYTIKAKPGNYMVFCPSYHYLDLLYQSIQKLVPTLPMALQKPEMREVERKEFLKHFDEHSKTAFLGFCVTGGIYSEGIDLVGKRLIGAIICGVGLPSISDEKEAICAYFQEKNEEGRAFAYVYPGMNRVLQAAGRVIRSEEDRGVVLLIDDRFGSPEYKKLIPEHWHGLHYVGNTESLSHLLNSFWNGEK